MVAKLLITHGAMNIVVQFDGRDALSPPLRQTVLYTETAGIDPGPGIRKRSSLRLSLTSK